MFLYDFLFSRAHITKKQNKTTKKQQQKTLKLYYVNHKQYSYEIHNQHQKLKNKFIIYSYKIHYQQKEIRYNDTLHM